MNDGARMNGDPVATDGDKPVVLSLRGITKRFPRVIANRDIDLDVHAGDIHVLLGENGAGKSTLIAILSGVYQPDAGSIAVAGREVRIQAPRDALALGIGTVYQHLALVPTLTVIENLMLGAPWYRLPDVTGTGTRLAELAGLLGIEVDGDAPVGGLSLGQQQQIEIIKALWHGERILILDEPTSMLTPQGVRELGKMIRRLRDAGVAVILITHKLGEACEFGERISVLKLGRLVGEIGPAELAAMSREEATRRIVHLMFGARDDAPRAAAIVADAAPGAPVLEVEGIAAAGAAGEPALADITFALRPGEVFGIAGVDGNGQKRLAEAIAGQRPIDAGDIRLDGRSIAALSIAKRQAMGLRYVTDDRLGEGTVAELSIAVNLLLKRIGEPPYWRRGIAHAATIERDAAEKVAAFDVRAPGIHTRVGTLSGGNVQKALLARELSQEPRVVIYNKPTHGLDLANATALHERIREQAEAGVAAIVISNELDELLGLCGRIGVMYRGRLRGIVENGAWAEARVGALMIGVAA